MKRIIITGAFSNNCPPYQNLAKWQIKSLNRMVDYCDYIGTDFFVVDNSTGFQDYFNEVRKYGDFLPCGWATGTLCSVWGLSNLYYKYDELIWIDLDTIVNNKYNIFEIMNTDFFIANSMINKNDVDNLFFTCKKKSLFSIEFMKCQQEQLYGTAAWIVKMTHEIADKLNNFWFKEIDYRKVVQYFKEKQTEAHRIDFACDECVYEAFINSKNIIPANIDMSTFFINFHEREQHQQVIIMKNKTDKFVHFASSYKQYIPEFLKIQEELQ